MPVPILMPALSPTMKEGKIAKWCCKEGDAVSSGDVIAEVETDKATMEVESVDDGVMARILVPEGTAGVKVNELVAILLEEGEDEAGVDEVIAEHSAKTSEQEDKEDHKKEETKETQTQEETEEQEQERVRGQAQEQSGAAEQKGGVAQSHDGRIFASPLARRLSDQKGIPLSQISGSGPHGRVIKRDVLEFTPTKAMVSNAGRNPVEYRTEPVSPMRQVIASRLCESKQTVPHFYLNASVIVDRLLESRKVINNSAPVVDELKREYRISVNDFVMKAVALAVKDVPEMNASWCGDVIKKYNNIDVSVAVALEDGLITPIVKNADRLSLHELSYSVKELVKKANALQLSQDEYEGGSVTVSNLGMYQIESFQAIINPPQSSIVSVGCVSKQPVVIEDEVQVAHVMHLSISCDHRVVDGATGAAFLNKICSYLEKPELMLV